MSEYRYNPITDQWIILAAKRNDRPIDFVRAHKTKPPDFDRGCPFCPGNEALTPPETYAVRPADLPVDKTGWSVRVVPNKYAALSGSLVDKGKAVEDGVGPLKSKVGLGFHEVIIESTSHRRSLGYHDDEQARAICQSLRQRYQNFAIDRQVKLISIFYNHGSSSGASLAHPHFQLLAQSVVPPRLIRQQQHCCDYYHKNKSSVFDDVISAELSAGHRVLFANEYFVALCPYASMCPFEIYLLPRFEQQHFGDLDDKLLGNFSQILQRTIRTLDNSLNYPDYNLAFHTNALNSNEIHSEGFRWYVQICPRLHNTGGFELATDVYINTVKPESAAALYRKHS